MWVNGVSIWSYKSSITKTFGSVTSITIDNVGSNYDAASPPTATISGGAGSGATAEVVVNGSLDSIDVTAGGSGYTSSPLVAIVGGGTGASATAIITKGAVSRILSMRAVLIHLNLKSPLLVVEEREQLLRQQLEVPFNQSMSPMVVHHILLNQV